MKLFRKQSLPSHFHHFNTCLSLFGFFYRMVFPRCRAWFWEDLIEWSLYAAWKNAVAKSSKSTLKNILVSFSAMDPVDEAYRNRISTVLRALYATKYAKEDNVPCQIEQVTESLKMNFNTIWFYQFTYFPSLLKQLPCFTGKDVMRTKLSCLRMGCLLDLKLVLSSKS